MTAARSVTCPSCGGTIEIKAAGYSVTVACQYCGSVLDVARPDVQLIEEYHEAALTLPLPLGSRGTLFDTEWEVIGYLERSDGDESWSEYLMFNPYAGYRWLTCAGGEWQFGTMLLDQPEGDRESVRWRARRFRRDYDPATTVTNRVVGEFYWRVRAGDQVEAMTYSDDDQTLSVEWGADETNWTQLVDISGKSVGTAFGVIKADADAPAAPISNQSFLASAAANQQSKRRSLGTDLLWMLLIAALTSMIMLVVMSVFGMSGGHATNALQLVVDGPAQSQTIGTIQANRPYQFVTVNARASDFTNRWIDLDYSLVNRATQQSIEASDTVEYYTGRDSDGNWTEGSRSTATKFAGVPRGTYDVVVDASAHSWSDGTYSQRAAAGWGGWETIAVQFDAHAGGIVWGNYIVLLVFLFGLPALITWFRSRS